MPLPIVMNVARPAGSIDPAALAERAIDDGLTGIGFADSPRLFDDPFLSAHRALERTSIALAGPCLLGLGLHHPTVVARAAATMAAHHPGRGLLVVGRGESSLVNEGLSTPTSAAYRTLLAELADRLAGLPAVGAASGPRTISTTARTLGGVLIDVGVDRLMVAKAVALARDSGASEVWLFIRAVVTDTAAQASAATALVGSCAARMARAPHWYGIAESDRESIAAVAAAHDYRRHGAPVADAQGGPGFDRVRQAFLLTGSVPEIAAAVRPLASSGLTGVVLAGAVPGVLERLGRTVAALRSGLAGVGDAGTVAR